MDGLLTPLWAEHAGMALPNADGTPVVLMVATPETTVRHEARSLVRTALRSFLAKLAGCAPEAVALHTEPGKAPHAKLDDLGVQLSISHEAGLSLAAVRTGGKVGVDLMRAADAAMPDWQAIAADYLGQATLAAITGHDAGQQPAAFAQAWTRHEAALKCLGLPLQEWTPALGRELARCHVRELALPPSYVGAVALCD